MSPQLDLVLVDQKRGAGDRQQRILDGELVEMLLGIEPSATTSNEQVTGCRRSGPLILGEALDQRRQRQAGIDRLVSDGEARSHLRHWLRSVRQRSSSLSGWCDAKATSSGCDCRSSTSQFARDDAISVAVVALCEPVAVVELRRSHLSEARTDPRR